MTGLKTVLAKMVKRLYQAGYRWWNSGHANEAAALAFYSLFSLIPILVLTLLVATTLVGKDTASRVLIEQTTEVTGLGSVDFLNLALRFDLQWFEDNYVSPVIGLAVLTFSATKVIHELRVSLSKIFSSERTPKKTRSVAVSLLISRGVSFLAIVVLGCTIAVSVVGESIVLSLCHFFEDSHNIYITKIVRYLSSVTSFLSLCFLSTLILRLLPQNPPKLKEAFLGSALCSTLLFILKFGLFVFLEHSSTTSMFGGAVTLVVLLIWIYFAMQLVLYSAEFTATLTREREAKQSE